MKESVLCSSLSASQRTAHQSWKNHAEIAVIPATQSALLQKLLIHSVTWRSFFHIQLSISIHTCLNSFQRTDISLSPVRTKFVSSLFACVICFFRISISHHNFLARSISQVFKASARAHFSTHNCCLSDQRSIAILRAIGLFKRSISCCDCESEFLSTSTTTWAVTFSTGINKNDYWLFFSSSSNAFFVSAALFFISSLSISASWFSACHSLSHILRLKITPSWSHMNCSSVKFLNKSTGDMQYFWQTIDRFAENNDFEFHFDDFVHFTSEKIDSYVLNLFSRTFWIITSISRDLSIWPLYHQKTKDSSFSIQVNLICFLIILYTSIICSWEDFAKKSWYSSIVACSYFKTNIRSHFSDMKSCSNVFLSGNCVSFIWMIVFKTLFFEKRIPQWVGFFYFFEHVILLCERRSFHLQQLRIREWLQRSLLDWDLWMG